MSAHRCECQCSALSGHKNYRFPAGMSYEGHIPMGMRNTSESCGLAVSAGDEAGDPEEGARGFGEGQIGDGEAGGPCPPCLCRYL
jgi:hypothetical protein